MTPPPPFARPRVLFSACLGFEACRYDASMVREEAAAAVARNCEALIACPERGAGLGVPRPPVRLVREGDSLLLLQPATGADCTTALGAWCAAEVARLRAGRAFDAILLKSRSPSCGPGSVKVYAGRGASGATEKGIGLFASALEMAFPDLPMEDEGRLRNFTIRDHFLITAHCRAEYREAREAGDLRVLLGVHTRWKLVLMAYNPVRARGLGRILAARGRETDEVLFAAYGAGLARIFARPIATGAMINALQHAFGGLSEALSPEVRRYFLDLLEEYRDERIPLSAVLRLLKGWAIAQGNEYLLGQRLLAPYPLDLLSISDSGKGRDY